MPVKGFVGTVGGGRNRVRRFKRKTGQKRVKKGPKFDVKVERKPYYEGDPLKITIDSFLAKAATEDK